MKSFKVIALVVVAAVLVIAGSVYAVNWYRVGRFIEETDNAFVAAHSVAIRPEISAKVTAVHVEDNQIVDRGQLLVELDREDLASERDRARARVAVAEANLEKAGEQIGLQRSKIEEAQARVESAEADVHRTELDLERAKRLASQEYGSKQNLQNSQAAYDVAVSQKRAAQATLAAQKRMLPVLKADQSSAQARLREARTNLAYAENQIGKTRIVAPEAGVVGDLTVEAGATAQPAGTLLHLVPIPDIFVIANYKETQIADMAIGQPVKIHVDAYPDRVFEGRVDSLSPATGAEFSLLPQDNATGNFNKIVQKVPVKIRLTEPPDRLAMLRPGLSVVPEVDTRTHGDGLVYRQQRQRTETGVAGLSGEPKP